MRIRTYSGTQAILTLPTLINLESLDMRPVLYCRQDCNNDTYSVFRGIEDNIGQVVADHSVAASRTDAVTPIILYSTNT